MRSVVIARQAELLAQADRLREAELAMQARPARSTAHPTHNGLAVSRWRMFLLQP